MESKELTKEEILKQEFLKFIPQERGDKKMTSNEFDKHIIEEKRIFDLILNAMQEYSDQNTKPLLDKIDILQESNKGLGTINTTYFNRIKDLTEENAKLKSDLKAAESVNELYKNGLIKSKETIRKTILWAEIPAEDRKQHYEFIDELLTQSNQTK